MADIHERIAELEQRLARLPVGYISRKMINGKERFYLQWTVNGKIKSKYIKNADVPSVREQIALRKQVQADLEEARAEISCVIPQGFGMANSLVASPDMGNPLAAASFNTRVVFGHELSVFAERAKELSRRDCFSEVQDYLRGNLLDKVCVVYGLRRSGKTTMIRQLINEMTREDLSRTVYIKATVNDTMASLNKDLRLLRTLGVRFVFIDEVTLISDFIDSAALLSDIYSAMGMKIVLSGTDSLGFWLAMHEELYDRAVMVHTTYIPFAEHARLLGIRDIDEYIQYGGTLKAGSWDFSSNQVQIADASFRDDESTRFYIDSAICSNIQNSLRFYDGGNHFRHLHELYEKNELTGAINRIIENESHQFLVRVLTEAFKSHDLHLAGRNLRKARDEAERLELFDVIDEAGVTARLMEILKVRNKEKQTVAITEDHVAEIKEYLTALELLDSVGVEAIGQRTRLDDIVLVTQPGMRFCQAKALVHALMEDQKFDILDITARTRIANKILDEVRGRLLEEIVLLDTKRRWGKSRRVFKLLFAAGEYDMVVFNPETLSCECYEIKHSGEITDEQTIHLRDEEKIAATTHRYGTVTRRCVLYRGESGVADNGIEYKNVTEFLTEGRNH